MTAGCSINPCKSALYVLLASLHSACFEPIEKQSAQPHLSGWGWAELMGICGAGVTLLLADEGYYRDLACFIWNFTCELLLGEVHCQREFQLDSIIFIISGVEEECSDATLIGVSALLRIVYLSVDYRTILYRLLGGLRRELGVVDELEDYRSDYRFITCIGLPNGGLPLSASEGFT